MYEAIDLETRDVYRFKSLDTLARRLGGDHWQLVSTSAFRPPTMQVQILKYDRKVDGSHVRATVILDTDDIEAMSIEATEADA